MATKKNTVSYNLRKVTTVRGFAESEARMFRVSGAFMPRNKVEEMSYAALKKAIRAGRVFTAYKK